MKRFCRQGIGFLLTLALFAGLLPALTAHAVSLEEKQRAVVLTAWAYYDKGRFVQYDSMGLSVVPKKHYGTLRSTHEVPPEYATPDETLYSVCSDFTYQVYFDVFGYRCCEDAVKNCTARMSKLEPGKDPICVYKYNTRPVKKDPVRLRESIRQYCALLQPGDIVNIVTREAHGGHAMLYIGDVYGDGVGYILHCAGGKYNTETGEDAVERKPDTTEAIPGRIKLSRQLLGHTNDGAIWLTPVEEYLWQVTEHKFQRILSIIRPLAVITDEEYPMSQAAKGRLQYPRLVYNRTASPYTRFTDVESGGTLTLNVELKNCSDAAYTVPVKETLPEGVRLVKASDGATVSGKEIAWNVALGAGETKTVSYDCTVTAKRGEKIVFEGGSAGTIPSNALRIPVGGKHLTDAENKLLAEVAEGKHMDLFRGVRKDDLPGLVWQKLLGLNVPTPTPKTMMKNVFTKTAVVKKNVYVPREDLSGEALTNRQMLAPEFIGGFYYGEMDSLKRVLDLRCEYLRPGDVVFEIRLVGAPNSGQTLVYLGNGKFLGQSAVTGGAAVTDWFALQKAHTYELFFALRPTLAYDDVHTLPALQNSVTTESLPFTDVKESDWYYNYVEELVADGTVSGMTATSFAPDGTLTYGQALKLIALAVGEKEPAKSGSHWASGYLTLAKSKGWLGEDVDPDGTITRLALCKIAAKAKKLTAQPEKNPFKDTDDKDVLALNRAGVVSGMTATEFKPDGLLTRAQISKIIVALRAAAEVPAASSGAAEEESD